MILLLHPTSHQWIATDHLLAKNPSVASCCTESANDIFPYDLHDTEPTFLTNLMWCHHLQAKFQSHWLRFCSLNTWSSFPVSETAQAVPSARGGLPLILGYCFLSSEIISPWKPPLCPSTVSLFLFYHLLTKCNYSFICLFLYKFHGKGSCKSYYI